ncbi:MAG: NAD-dependent DNA ligase LigA [Anaerolineaceae bacterium]|nr:NAD-dependent DNA ligase LigA [Anaerolineaceae bacterium]
MSHFEQEDSGNTDNSSLKDQLEALKEKINEYAYHYYGPNASMVSNAEYDQLFKQLEGIEASHPEWVTSGSPTQRVGGVLSEGFQKVNHPAPILSLASVTDLKGVRSWVERISKLDERVLKADFTIEPKIDGLTIVVHYENGILSMAASRGNGEVGEDITSNVKTIRSVPLKLRKIEQYPDIPQRLVVRGEAFIRLPDFETLNEEMAAAGGRTYLNPRNTAAGALRQLDPGLTAQRPLTWFCYSIVDVSDEFLLPETQWERLNLLKNWGFPVSSFSTYVEDIERVIQLCEERLTERAQLDFEVDGIVIKINNIQLSDDLGIVGKDPRGALALKYPAREVTTKLLEIQTNVGRTGVITPFAVLEPVKVGGVTVQHATLHNFDFIQEKDIREGDRVLIKRAGDVIPYVIGPITEVRDGSEKPYVLPKHCPSCGSVLENFEGEVAWYCVNTQCPAQLIRHLEHFVSQSAMNIVGLGIRIVKQLIDAGLVSDLADLYTLDRDVLLSLEGFGEKKVDNLLTAIETSKQQSLSRLLNGLGIRGVGEVMAADMAARYGSLSALGKATQEELEAIEGVGPNIARAIVDWFARNENQTLLTKMESVGLNPVELVEKVDAQSKDELKLGGLTFVITGTLPSFSRNEMKAMLIKHGGKVTGSVSKKTSYLIAGEAAGSKLGKAKEFGVPILDESGLLAMIGEKE